MKARVKATGDIVDVVEVPNPKAIKISDVRYQSDYRTFSHNELEFICKKQQKK